MVFKLKLILLIFVITIARTVIDSTSTSNDMGSLQLADKLYDLDCSGASTGRGINGGGSRFRRKITPRDFNSLLGVFDDGTVNQNGTLQLGQESWSLDCIKENHTATTSRPNVTSTSPASTNVTTRAPGNHTIEPGELIEGNPCNISDCEIRLGCKSYLYCKRLGSTTNPDEKDGIVVKQVCHAGHFPEAVFSENTKVVVAACSAWMDLSSSRKEEILRDEECAHCQIIPVGNCSSQFRYRDEHGVLSESVTTCPAGSIIDIERRSCTPICLLSAELRQICVSSGVNVAC